MRNALFAAGAMSLALVLGACGDGEEDASKGNPAGSSSAPAPPPAGEDGSGARDAQSLLDAVRSGAESAKSAKLTLAGAGGGGKGLQGTGSAHFDGKATKLAVKSDAGGQRVEFRMLGPDLYVKMPAGGAGGNSSKPWMKMALDGVPGFTNLLEYTDPTKLLANMRASDVKLANSKPAKVDGKPVTHHSLTVNTQKMMERMGGGASAAPPAGEQSLPLELYVDAENLPVQVEMAGAKTNYTDWGDPVTIEAPPESEVSEQPPPGQQPQTGQQPQPGQTPPN